MYVAICSIGDKALVKVGISDHPERRFQNLQTGCPVPIQSLYAAELRNRETAFAAEHEAHRRLSRHRTQGEWFQFVQSGLDAMFAEVDAAVATYKGRDLQRIALMATWNWDR